MRALFVPAITLAMSAPVALAQNQQSGSQQSGGQQSGGQGDPSKQAALRNQQQVRDDLTKADFKNVQILDETYLASGKTKNGDEITMMNDPKATSASSGSSGSSSQPKGNTQ